MSCSVSRARALWSDDRHAVAPETGIDAPVGQEAGDHDPRRRPDGARMQRPGHEDAVVAEHSHAHAALGHAALQRHGGDAVAAEAAIAAAVAAQLLDEQPAGGVGAGHGQLAVRPGRERARPGAAGADGKRCAAVGGEAAVEVAGAGAGGRRKQRERQHRDEESQAVAPRDERRAAISATSVGVCPTRTPWVSSASCLALAVPAVPDTIAPACPIVLPGGAVKPAM